MERVLVDKNCYSMLERVVGSDRITAQLQDRIYHSYDATRQKAMPEVVVRPLSADEVSQILKIADEQGIPVYPRGAASGLSGGAVPLHGGIALDMTRMNRILEVDEGNMVATVEPGVVLADLQKAVERKNLFYPPDPASREFATVGGTVAECSGGMRGLKYGVTKDYVLALEVALAGGDIIRLGTNAPRSVTGYDLVKLFVGSEGTLGVFTRITMKLLPLPQCAMTALVHFADVYQAVDASCAIVAAGITPRALELMDGETIRAVENYLQTGISRRTGALLLVEVDGYREVAERELDRALGLCRDRGALEIRRAETDDEREDIWVFRRSISPALYTISSGKINEDICVPRTRLGEMLRRLEEIGSRHRVKVVNFGHAGDGNIHVNFMVDRSDEAEMARGEAAAADMFREAISLGGTLSAEHGIGNTKSKYLDLEVQPLELRLMREIKKLLDPQGILNPGKIFHDARDGQETA